MANKPTLMLVDDDPQVLAAIRRDVRRRYHKDYRVVGADSAANALEALEELRQRGEAVAMMISDQRMPTMNGVDFLEQARELHPQAKRLLLTAYADTDAAIQAINDVSLDYYLMKPWDPPEEKIYPVLDELLFDWLIHYRPDFRGLRVIGFQWSPKSHHLKDFLTGNLVPYRWHDVESGGDELLEKYGLERTALPAVILEDGTALPDPELAELATRAGIRSSAGDELYDVVIIGAGPAGLAAAVYGASEGLRTLLVERRAPGGQAGTSSRIENYLGFPTGLSGAELTRRAVTQVKRLGAELAIPQEVTRIEISGPVKTLSLRDGETVRAKSVVVAAGVDYRKLAAEGIDDFTGAGIYYGSAATEAQACTDGEVYIVGGGNSAGQAAMHLSRFACTVHIVIRRPDLTATMSAYLIDQLEATPNVKLYGRTVVSAARGGDRLETLELTDLDTEETREVPATAMYIFIGAKPYTEWLADLLLLEPRGFIRTGLDLHAEDDFKTSWKLEREPFALESSRPGIFAAGDIRAGAMNRVASAVGEGAMAIKLVHDYLSTV
ncbi:MAG: FAD-dependent oxidoreductase [Acidobacteriota bacterium]